MKKYRKVYALERHESGRYYMLWQVPLDQVAGLASAARLNGRVLSVVPWDWAHRYIRRGNPHSTPLWFNGSRIVRA
jgi:hypothetical protein